MSRYVAITRQEFEDLLRSFRRPYSLKQGTKGVYVVELSKNVGLAINSTIGDTVRSVGKASIQLNFVSLHQDKYHRVIYGYKKIMQRVVKKKYLQRSTNWKVTLKDAVDKCIVFYQSNNKFLEMIALPEDQQQAQSQPQIDSALLSRIESIPSWNGNDFLQSLHNQVSKGRTLSDKQLGAIKKFEQRSVRTPAPQPQQSVSSNLDIMRDLYVSLRSGGASDDDLEELAEIGKNLKKKNSISATEMEILGEICGDYGVQVPNFSFGNQRLAKRADHWNKVRLGNDASGIYYRGIPTGRISKESKGYEAFIYNMGKQTSLGVFRNEDQAFAKIQSEQ